MKSFDARLRLVGGMERTPLGVEIDLTDNRMLVKSNGEEIADWELSNIRVFSLPDGFHIRVEGEEVIINVNESTRFASEMGKRLRISGRRGD